MPFSLSCCLQRANRGGHDTTSAAHGGTAAAAQVTGNCLLFFITAKEFFGVHGSWRPYIPKVRGVLKKFHKNDGCSTPDVT